MVVRTPPPPGIVSVCTSSSLPLSLADVFFPRFFLKLILANWHITLMPKLTDLKVLPFSRPSTLHLESNWSKHGVSTFATALFKPASSSRLLFWELCAVPDHRALFSLSRSLCWWRQMGLAGFFVHSWGNRGWLMPRGVDSTVSEMLDEEEIYRMSRHALCWKLCSANPWSSPKEYDQGDSSTPRLMQASTRSISLWQ